MPQNKAICTVVFAHSIATEYMEPNTIKYTHVGPYRTITHKVQNKSARAFQLLSMKPQARNLIH